MNKDVIYIEPEDDITDIITKIENSKEKIVALVPPKKTAVFRSLVNVKLMAKAGKNAEKTIVLVTTDPSIVKLAAATRVPVTKNLQSAPAVPSDDTVEENGDGGLDIAINDSGDDVSSSGTTGVSDDTANVDDAPVTPEASPAVSTDGDASAEKAVQTTLEMTDEDTANAKDQDDEKVKGKTDKKARKGDEAGGNKFTTWVKKHKILLIVGSLGVVGVAVLLVWMNVIAPAATINVEIRTTASNFSENVTFTEKLADEDISKGVFYLEQKKLETKSEVEFEATGKKNVGKKASGEVVVYTYFRDAGAVAVNAGSIFTNNGKSFIADKDTTLSWDGKDAKACDNNGAASAITSGCLISARVPVIAAEAGSSYNLAASNTGWTTAANVGVYSDAAMGGGTDETVTVVQQSDVDAAKEKIANSNESANKAKLFATIDDGDFIIESSFKQSVGDATVTPAVGEQVKEGAKAKLTVVTTDEVFVLDDTKVEEYIKEKAKLAENSKIYQMNDPFVENFTKTETGYVGKLKTSYVSGPEVTEEDVYKIVAGKGLGTARDELIKTYSGISKVTTEVSYPWVSGFPTDRNKITINISVEK